MSQENVDRLVAATESFNRLGADTDSIPAEDFAGLLEAMDPQIHFEPHQALIEGSYEGLDGFGTWLVDVAESYRGGRMQYDDIRDLGDRVLALGTLRISGKSSGIEMEFPLAIVATLSDGLITHLKDYGDTTKALAAVGLSE